MLITVQFVPTRAAFVGRRPEVSPRNFFLTLGLDALLELCYSMLFTACNILGRLLDSTLPDLVFLALLAYFKTSTLAAMSEQACR